MSQSTAELEKRSRKSYTTKKKIEIISFAKKNSIHKASIKYALDRKNIRRWINKEAELTKLKSSVTSGSLRKRLDGGGRHMKEVELEKRLLLWVQDERKKKHRVSRCMIFREGRILLKHIESERGIDSTLKLSVGWLEKFIEKKNSDRGTYTKGGNPRAPPPEVYLSWIDTAWQELPEELIKKSFKVCGIGIKQGGSEDNKIHCFSQSGSIPKGFELLQQARQPTVQPEEMIELLEESVTQLSIVTDNNDNIVDDLSDISLDFDF